MISNNTMTPKLFLALAKLQWNGSGQGRLSYDPLTNRVKFEWKVYPRGKE